MLTKVEELIRDAGIKACLFYNCTEDRIVYQLDRIELYGTETYVSPGIQGPVLKEMGIT